MNAVDDGQADFRITGTAATGGTLSALIGVDPDGPWDETTAAYEWFRDGVSQGVKVGDRDYAVTAADVGHILSVRATYADAQGFTTSFPVTSLPAPIGILAVQPVAGLINSATVTALNTLTDPDGDLPGASQMLWQVSTTGAVGSFVDAPALGVTIDANGNLELPTASIMFVQLTLQYIDAGLNLNTASSEPVRIQTGANGAQALTGIAGTDILFGLAG
ncbi:MAG: hypothetical protein NT117_10115, partial [Gammaproteobacteria bacterium]|nr:hypothetical protein [Gammaproteobacteria bacterium]